MRLTLSSILISLSFFILTVHSSSASSLNPRCDDDNVIDITNVAQNLVAINAKLILQYIDTVFPTFLANDSAGAKLATTMNSQISLLNQLATAASFFGCDMDISILIDQSNPTDSTLAAFSTLHLEILLNLGMKAALNNDTVSLDSDVAQTMLAAISSTNTIIGDDADMSNAPNITQLDYAIILKQFSPAPRCAQSLGLDDISFPNRIGLIEDPPFSLSVNQSMSVTNICNPSPSCFCEVVSDNGPDAAVFPIINDTVTIPQCVFNNLGVNLVYFTSDGTALAQDPNTRAEQNVTIIAGPLLFIII